MKRAVAITVLLAQTLPAQSISSWNVARWYQTPEVRDSRQGNSPRLRSLVQAGQLRLTLADAIALAIENNLNLEAARYGPLLAESALKRAEAGGPVRGVPSASAQVSSVNAGVGVNGSTASAGLGGGGNGGNGGSNGGASIQQIGAITPNLDPIVQNTTTFSHLSQPLANTIVAGTSALVQSTHTYTTSYRQGLLSGGFFQILDYQQSLAENAPTNSLNPANGQTWWREELNTAGDYGVATPVHRGDLLLISGLMLYVFVTIFLSSAFFESGCAATLPTVSANPSATSANFAGM